MSEMSSSVELAPTDPPRPPRPGQLVNSWRVTLAVGWAALMAAIMVTAGAAEVLHRSVWWIGDRADPAPVVLALVPFLGPIAVIVLLARDLRGAAEMSVVASLATLAVAWGDRTNSPSAAVVMAALGVAALLLSIAAFSGRVRRA